MPVDGLVEFLRWSQTGVFLLVGVWSLWLWRRRRDEQSRWLAATFASLGSVAVGGVALELAYGQDWPEVLTKLLVAVLVLFPYLLLRFLDSFEPVPRWARLTVGWWILGLVAASFGLPEIPEPGEPYGAFLAVYTVAVVASWVVVLPVVGWRFWAAGRRQPTLARRRLRLIGIAVVVLSVAIVLTAVDNDPPAGLLLATQLTALLTALLLLVGFAPPPVLRQLWRQHEEQALHTAALDLMATVSPEDVADVLVPHLRTVVAARAVALVHDGRVVGSDGASVEDVRALAGDRHAEVVTTPLTEGAIHVWTDRYTPFFGQDELHLLQRTGLLADLAFARNALLASEQEARDGLARTNAELESFVYSASHDLKSPLIAMLSYVDLLTQEHATQLEGEGAWYLDRLATNGRYMESLINDLLELSRVGRSQTAPERIDLTALVTELGAELPARYPQATVEVDRLPTVWMNGLRARQLFTNLLENAAKHAAGQPVTIRVDATPGATMRASTVVRVRDDGPGVPEAYRERIFGVFERLNPEDQNGTGIGLAICRKIVESVGGRIWLSDRADGAEFLLHLPVAAAGAGRLPAEEVPA